MMVTYGMHVTGLGKSEFRQRCRTVIPKPGDNRMNSIPRSS